MQRYENLRVFSRILSKNCLFLLKNVSCLRFPDYLCRKIYTNMKKILLMICALTLLVACSQDDDVNQVKPLVKARRTVLVYAAAENNLNSFLDENLTNMKKGSLQLNDDQNLVVYVNRAQETNPCYLARIYQGELVDTVLCPTNWLPTPQ